MLHIHHNTQPLPIDKAHEAAAPARRTSDVARKLVLTHAEFAAIADVGQRQQAEVQNAQRPMAQSNAAATKQPWVSPGSYLPAPSDSFRVH